jgi:non-heme Fe2+,alpha-ketoglutarate-dependent halogenase
MHASLPHAGKTKEMRLGFASRYVPASVTVYASMKETNRVTELGGSFSLENFGAIVVSGRDEYGHNKIRTHTTTGIPFVNSNPR